MNVNLLGEWWTPFLSVTSPIPTFSVKERSLDRAVHEGRLVEAVGRV